MHAGSKSPRTKARTPHRVELRGEAADAIAAKYNLKTNEEQAAFFGLAGTTWARLRGGRISPGEEIIAAVLGSHPEDTDITFDALFVVVTA